MDPILADAYSFGMILYCMDMGGLIDVDQGAQIRGEIPDLSGCEVFGTRIELYLEDVYGRRRLSRDDLMDQDLEHT